MESEPRTRRVFRHGALKRRFFIIIALSIFSFCSSAYAEDSQEASMQNQNLSQAVRETTIGLTLTEDEVNAALEASFYDDLWTPVQAPSGLIPDPNLRSLIRETLRKPSGEITVQDLEKITKLDGAKRGISNIDGFQYCVNLVRIDLSGNQICDITPLANLQKLSWVDVKHNRIIDVSPLAYLPNLNKANLEYNSIQDIKPLVSNTGLGKGDAIAVSHNPLTGYANLKGLTDRGILVYYYLSPGYGLYSGGGGHSYGGYGNSRHDSYGHNYYSGRMESARIHAAGERQVGKRMETDRIRQQSQQRRIGSPR